MAWDAPVLAALLGCGLLQLLLVLLLWRRPDKSAESAQALMHALDATRAQLARELRQESQDSSRAARQEAASTMATFQQTVVQHSAEATRTQNARMDAFGAQLAAMQKGLADTLNAQLSALSEANARRLLELNESSAAGLRDMRSTLEAQLA